MTTPEKTTGSMDDLIDQIVDGTLTPAQLREAIERLDREPDGWKRCTLAFLEAQCWRESFRLVGEPKQSGGHDVNFRPLKPRGGHLISTGRRWLSRAVAASVLAASFALGWLGHGAQLGRAPDTTVAVGETALPTEPAPTLPPEAPQPAIVYPALPGQPASAGALAQVMTVAHLRVASGDAMTTLPILAGPGINAEWLERQPPPVSEHGKAVLQQHGYQVDQRRRLVSATRADGLRVTVPIDQVRIRFTGNNPL